MSATGQVTSALIDELSGRLGSDAVLTDPADCWTYGYDNSRRQQLPAAVLMPGDHEEVVTAVQACNRHSVSLTVRGRGTGTAGAAVPTAGGIALSTERLNRIHAIDGDNRVAVVQPGVCNGELQRAAGERGFFWPPDPTSADYCSIGGNLGCNSAGPRAIKYGTPRENTLGLRAVAGDGTSLRTGCYTTKGVVGYDFTRLLIGSEGTLAVITEATLLLTPLPPCLATMRATYRKMSDAAAAVSAIMAQPSTPRALEFMDAASISLIRHMDGCALADDVGAMLIIDFDGLEATVAEGVETIRTAASNRGMLEFRQARNAVESASLWAARKALSPALRTIAPKKINEDVVVPVSRMAEFIDALNRLGERYNIRIVNFGHAGNGNIHVNLLGNPDDPGENERMNACLADVFNLVLRLGGTLSGEHGVGFEKRTYVGLEIEPATLALMEKVKDQFDPAGILNPGKMFPEGAVST
ncbi:MAG: FAD-binding oxidoreductase [Gammaproteobacteria bacterium]|nr:MAG: FAD-binding oxidoreductase [Gammaproteobacteria bacterium]